MLDKNSRNRHLFPFQYKMYFLALEPFKDCP